MRITGTIATEKRARVDWFFDFRFVASLLWKRLGHESAKSWCVDARRYLPFASVLKYNAGVVLKVFLNIEINELGVL